VVAIASIAPDGKHATVLLSTFEALGIDLTSKKKHNFFIRAVIYAEDGITVVNQSQETQFSLIPSKLT